MSIKELFYYCYSSALFAAGALLAVSVIFILVYYVIYIKMCGGAKRISLRRLFLPSLLIFYYTMLLYVCVFRRFGDAASEAAVSLHPFESYLAAWNTFSLVPLQMLFLNILIYVPIGFITAFIPVLRRLRFALPLFVGVSLSVELMQILFKRGMFELDDLFNNTLGAVLGFCLVMCIAALVKKRKAAFAYLTVVLLPFIALLAVTGIYNANEYGNLLDSWTYKQSVKAAEFINIDILSSDEAQAAVYKTNRFTKKQAMEALDKYADTFGENDFIRTGTTTEGWNNIYSYSDKSLTLYVSRNGGYYSYINRLIFHERTYLSELDEDSIRAQIALYGGKLPESAGFSVLSKGEYLFSVDEYFDSDIFERGFLTCSVRNDGVVMRFDSNILMGSYYSSEKIKSPSEAFEAVRDGRFSLEMDSDIKSIQVLDYSLSYSLDSKGFIQPVYIYKCIINGSIEAEISVAALYRK